MTWLQRIAAAKRRNEGFSLADKEEVKQLAAQLAYLAQYFYYEDGILTFPDGDYVETRKGPSYEQLQARIAELEAQNRDLVLRNRLLRDRTDLPIERLQAYTELMKRIEGGTC